MSEQMTCSDAQQKLQHIKTLENEFNEVLNSTLNHKNDPVKLQEYRLRANKVKMKLDRETTSLVEQANPFERLFNLQEQYQKQIHVLETAKILEEIEVNGEKVRGFTDIDGYFQPLPTLKEVIDRLREKRELLELKKEQGFGKIRLVPFGMGLEDLAKKYKQVLVSKAKENKLFTARKDRNDPKEKQVPLQLDLTNPLFIANEYKDADKSGNLVYHVTEFDKQYHGGKIKSEILKERRDKNNSTQQTIDKPIDTTQSGWDIIVLENEVNIPRQGKGKELGPDSKKRAQIEANKSPKQYLELFQTPQYQGEVGLTPEEALIHSITELIDHNEVIDDYQENGSICYNLGAYLRNGLPSWAESSGLVPYSFFVRYRQQANLYGNTPTDHDVVRGLRSGVRV